MSESAPQSSAPRGFPSEGVEPRKNGLRPGRHRRSRSFSAPSTLTGTESATAKQVTTTISRRPTLGLDVALPRATTGLRKRVLAGTLVAATLVVVATLGAVGLASPPLSTVRQSDDFPPKSPAISWGLGPQLVLPEIMPAPTLASTVAEQTTKAAAEQTTTSDPVSATTRPRRYPRPTRVPQVPAVPPSSEPTTTVDSSASTGVVESTEPPSIEPPSTDIEPAYSEP